LVPTPDVKFITSAEKRAAWSGLSSRAPEDRYFQKPPFLVVNIICDATNSAFPKQA
jgi:hypothetical protein